MMILRGARLPAGLGAAAAAAGVFLILAGSIPRARFTRERIEIQVRPSGIEVEGVYVFENPWPLPVAQGLKYPFLSDGAHPVPDSAEVAELDPATGEELRALPTLWLGGTPRYTLRIPGGASAHVRVRYRQAAADGSGAYLLTTTRLWGRPLERGEYVLVPRGVRITASSYPLDGKEPFSFVREGFLPDEDWRFAWAGG